MKKTMQKAEEIYFCWYELCKLQDWSMSDNIMLDTQNLAVSF